MEERLVAHAATAMQKGRLFHDPFHESGPQAMFLQCAARDSHPEPAD
jgi:hypothetical protein